jgi:hypothetical protein
MLVHVLGKWKRGWVPLIISGFLIYMSLIPLPFMQKIPFAFTDKVMHTLAFFVLACAYLWSFQKMFYQKAWKLTAAITIGIGGIIEILQTLLPVNRYGDWFDFLFDTIGTALALVFYPKIFAFLRKYLLVWLAMLFFYPALAQDSLVSAEEYQNELRAYYLNPETSPIGTEGLETFEGLYFFPIDSNFRIEARLVRLNAQPFFQMRTTTNRLPEYRVWAEVLFVLDGKEVRLKVYQNKNNITSLMYSDYLFLPFTDQTNGDETYLGGRYLDLRITENDSITLDFNKAYHPYCAYNKKYSCPVVPESNHIDFPLRAGVRFKRE